MKSQIAVIFLLIVVACCSFYQLGEQHEKPMQCDDLSEPYVWIKPDTGCQYLRGPGFSTPNLGSDGFPLCGNQKEVTNVFPL